MSKYYDLDKLKDMIEAKAETLIGDGAIAFHAVGKWLDFLPAADVDPVVHAFWVKSELSRDRNVYICSRCARTVSTPLGVSFDVVLDENPYCHCGARMDEEAEK